uniref:Gag protein n=1 Tax=Meloidogyne incognita TaxID=6306 RepID=A0A914MU11_MELIC
MEAIDTMLRQLKDFKDEVSIKAKVAVAKSDKELKEEEIKYSQKMQSTSAQSGGTPQINTSTISSVYQLPTLQIKPFNGTRKDWVEFYESFKCAVDSGNGSDVEKLTLLRNLVDGEAKELIAGFRLEAKSYKEALRMLKDNYGDKDAYIRSLHTRLTNLKACVTLGDVRRFSIELERLARELLNSGEDIEGPSVYLALEKKLNKPFLRTILSKRSEGNNWSTTQFREALREAIQKEMAIQEVMNEYEREVPRRPNRMSFQPMQRSNQFQRRSAPTQNQRQDFTYATLAQGQQIKPNQIKRSSSRRPRVSSNQTMDRQPQPNWKCAFCDEQHFNDR